MKKVYTFFLAVILTAICLAQAPQKMSYQAVIRDAGGTLVQSHAVGMRIQILQTSEFGAAVYVETHATSTNANGLVTLEIGSGNVVLGTFAGINWAAGPYFIKTETDPTGGTSYSIMGTSQLLSVPYALYAKTADNVTGTVAIANGGTGATTVSGAKTSLGLGNVDNTTDLLKPISTATQTALNLKSPLASPTFTGTPLATTAAAGTNTTQIATTAFVTSALNASVPAHSIGESYGGGIVFYVYDNGQHGLIAATADQSTGVVWTNTAFQSTVSNAVRNGVNGGFTNTERIIIQAGAGSYAAQLCANYKGGNYADWYLPSKYELNLLYLQKAVVGGFASNNYWSSTEYDNSMAWDQFFVSGSGGSNSKFATSYVRAIRAF